MLWRAVKALSAAIAIAVLLVGMPWALAALGGNPLEPIGQFARDPMMHDQGQIAIAVFTIIGWIGYATFAIATIAEAPSLFGRATRRVPGLGFQQWLARVLLSTIAAVLITQSTGAAKAIAVDHPIARHPVSVSTTAVIESAVKAHTVQASTSVEDDQDYLIHTVQRGEALLTLAERYYDHPSGMSRIAEANYGIEQPDGKTLQRGETRIRAGWQLRIPQPTQGFTATANTAATAASSSQHEIYEVKRDDYLSSIAARTLGDASRYPEIAADNPQLITDPDHIETGWQLTLPSDAIDLGAREHAAGQISTATPPAPQQETTTVPPAPVAPLPTDDGSDTPTPATQQNTPSPQPHAETSAKPETPPGATAASPAPNSPSKEAVKTHAGLHLSIASGAWLTAGLVAVLAEVWFLVRWQRRRFQKPEWPITVTHETGEPAPSLTMSGIIAARMADQEPALQQIAGSPSPGTLTSAAVSSDGSELSLHHDLTGLTVLTGPGSTSAARAIIAATLASSLHRWGPQQGELTTDLHTIDQLLESQPIPADLPRITITGSAEDTAAKLEQQVMHRARVLRNAAADTIGAFNADDDNDPFGLYLAIVPADERTNGRVAAAAGQGQRLGITVIVLGAIPDNPAGHVNDDGTITSEPGHDVPRTIHNGRLAVLAPDDLADMLRILAQADDDSSQEHDAPLPPPGPDLADAEPVSPGPEGSVPPPHASPAMLAPARTGEPPITIKVFGAPEIHTAANGIITKGPRGRTPAMLAYLASHPHQAHSLDELAFAVEPDSDPKLIKDILHTTIRMFRKSIFDATGIDGKTVLTQQNSRYRLNPENVEIDLWRMHAHLDTANHSTDDERTIAELRKAVACYTAEFATNVHHAWVISQRTLYRKQATDALTRIAELLEAEHPDAALAALEQALRIEGDNSVNEPLFQTIMRVQGRLGRISSVKTTMEQLREQLWNRAHREPNPTTEGVYARMTGRQQAATA